MAVVSLCRESLFLLEKERPSGERKLSFSGSDKDDLLNQLTGETRVRCCYLVKKHTTQTAPVMERKVRATIGEYAPNTLGYTRASMAITMRCNAER